MNRSKYAKNVGEWLEIRSGCTLSDFCTKFGYDPIYATIIGFDPSDEKKNGQTIRNIKELKSFYSKAYKDECFMRRCGKNRTVTSYCQYLITGWIMEDLTIEMFRRQGIEISHNGTDSIRKIEIDGSVTQNADCIIKVGGNSRKVELSNEFNFILGENGFIEKRAPALYSLWKEKGIWLYRDLINCKYVLIDFATENVKLHLRRHNTVKDDWSKDVHRYILEKNWKKVRDERLLAPELISVVGCGIEGKEQPELSEVIDEDSPSQDWDIGGKLKCKSDTKQKQGNDDGNFLIQKEKTDERTVKKDIIGCKKKEELPAKQLSTVQDEEDPDMLFDSSADADDCETDWNAVAMANEQNMEF